MKTTIFGETSITINATKKQVWRALTDPNLIRKYFFGTNTVTTWQPGSPIKFMGEWKGKRYEDKGTVVENKEEQLLQYKYWSSMSGIEDKPENYMIVTYLLHGEDNNVTLTLRQENIPDETTKTHSIENWKMVLADLKKMLEEK